MPAFSKQDHCSPTYRVTQWTGNILEQGLTASFACREKLQGMNDWNSHIMDMNAAVYCNESVITIRVVSSECASSRTSIKVNFWLCLMIKQWQWHCSCAWLIGREIDQTWHLAAWLRVLHEVDAHHIWLVNSPLKWIWFLREFYNFPLSQNEWSDDPCFC